MSNGIAHTAHRVVVARFNELHEHLERLTRDIGSTDFSTANVNALDIDYMRTPGGLNGRQALPGSTTYRADQLSAVLPPALPVIGDVLDAVRNIHPALGCAALDSQLVYPGTPKRPCGHDWHTDAGYDGWKLLLDHVSQADLSGFCYADTDNTIVDQPDRVGWNARLFFVRPVDAPFWHCVYTKQLRLSFGINLGTLPEALIHDLFCSR